MSIIVSVTDTLTHISDPYDHDPIVLGLGVALECFARMSDDPTTQGMFCHKCEDERIMVSFGNPHRLPSDSPFSVHAFVPGGLYYTFTPGDQEDWSLFHRFALPAIAARPGFHGSEVGEYLDQHRSARC